MFHVPCFIVSMFHNSMFPVPLFIVSMSHVSMFHFSMFAIVPHFSIVHFSMFAQFFPVSVLVFLTNLAAGLSFSFSG